MPEINRIIAEASKVSRLIVALRSSLIVADILAGIQVCQASFLSFSKPDMIRFYNNQVRKDQELTEKIAWHRNKVCLPLLTNPLTLKKYAF